MTEYVGAICVAGRQEETFIPSCLTESCNASQTSSFHVLTCSVIAVACIPKESDALSSATKLERSLFVAYGHAVSHIDSR